MKTTTHKPPRLIPGIIIAALILLVRYLLPLVYPEAMLVSFFTGFLGWLAVLVWWSFFSRAPGRERWMAPVVMVAALVLASLLLDNSIATANMGMMFGIYAPPVVAVAFVAWTVAARAFPGRWRLITMIVTILLASGIWIFLRTDGMDGNGRHDLAWRWAVTDEERLLAGGEEKPGPVTPGIGKGGEADWPGFRGPRRNGIVHGLTIGTDWSAAPPVEVWRKPVGPGCSSFAIRGGLCYTQEQRGEFELVSCYDLETGEAVWVHEDRARFYDSHAGPGPRSTPTISGTYVVTAGATGILNLLNASDGSRVWTRDGATETGAEVLEWGFTASPLVVGDVVVASLSGIVAGYDLQTGRLLWTGRDIKESYSSPHLVTLGGIRQVLLVGNAGAISLDPVTGEQLWEYPWEADGRILQPALAENGDLVLTREARELRRVAVSMENDTWTFDDCWTSDEIKLNFNDFVIHRGYLYGFDGPSLACVNLENGHRTWKGNRYRGWLLLLEEQDLLLILSEKGDLALVRADPERFVELARIRVLEGKTWNHPALAGNILLVRNAREMAAYRLPELNK